MRTSGARPRGDGPAGHGLGPHDHLCWTFEGYPDFLAAAVPFVEEGLDQGLRTVLVADRPLADLRADVLGPGGVRDAEAQLDRGALLLASVADTYGQGGPFGPEEQLETYAELTRQAVADGYQGFRAAADCTTFLCDPTGRDAFARYEHRIDRLMCSEPYSAMCAYDVAVAGRAPTAELACLHPVRPAGTVSFGLFAGPDDELLLTGDVDAALDPLFAQAVERVLAGVCGEHAVVDCAGLDYLDSQGLAALDRLAERAGVILELAVPPRSTERLVAMVDPLSLRIGRRR